MWVVTMLAGTALMALAVNLFLVPLQLAEGGFVGIAIILYHLAKAPVWSTYLLLNIPAAVLAVVYRGWAFLGRSALGMASFTAMLYLSRGLVPVTTNQLLGVVYGGLAMGIGLGLVLRAGATTGGSDLLAVLLHRTLNVSFGTFLLVFDVLVIAGAGVAFRSAETALLAAITLAISSRTVDYIQEGFYGAKGVSIITTQPETVARGILQGLERGCTVFPGTGAYTGRPRSLVYAVVQRGEITALKRVVRAADPNAFMIIADVREVLGEGFGSWDPNKSSQEGGLI